MRRQHTRDTHGAAAIVWVCVEDGGVKPVIGSSLRSPPLTVLPTVSERAALWEHITDGIFTALQYRNRVADDLFVLLASW